MMDPSSNESKATALTHEQAHRDAQALARTHEQALEHLHSHLHGEGAGIGHRHITLEPGEAEAELQRALKVLEPGFSRNRHFDHFDSPEGRQLLSFRRLAQGLLSDLEQCEATQPVRYEAATDGMSVRLELFIERYKVTRRSVITPLELLALRQHPAIGPRLREATLEEWEHG